METVLTTAAASNNAASNARKRKAVIPPKRIFKGMSLFDYLSQCQPPLDKKIIEIACIQTGVPPELRDDAGQEILIMWSNSKPDTSAFKPGQVASYAHRMARHACLRTRRELGSSVRLPGSAFRKREDGTSYVTPGVLAAALNWDDLESWFQADDSGSSESAAMQAALSNELGVEGIFEAQDANVTIAAVDAEEEALRVERMEHLEANRDRLTDRQFAIMEAMVNGDTYEEIMAALSIKKGVLMREINIAASVMGPLE